MEIAPKLAPFASSNRSFVRESRARLEQQQQQTKSSTATGLSQSFQGSLTTPQVAEPKTSTGNVSADRSFVKQSRLLQQQLQPNLSFQELTSPAKLAADEAASSNRQPTSHVSSSSPFISTERSFVKQSSSSNKLLTSNSFQGTFSAAAARPPDEEESARIMTAPAVPTTPPLSLGTPATASEDAAGTSRIGIDAYDFWAEFSQEEDVEHVVAMLNVTVDNNNTSCLNNNNTTLTGPKELLQEATKQQGEEESVTAVVKSRKVSLEDMDTAKSQGDIIYRDGDTDDEESLQPNNTSVNTFAALNITHATLNVSALAAIDETADFSVCGQAMEDCCQATQLLSDKKYDQALVLFQQAVAGYEKVGELVASVNAGGCYRNMATVCRMLERYSEAERHLVKAQEIYVQCRDQIDAKNEQAVLTLDGNLLENSEVQGDVSADTCEEEYVCVDALILETMQSRALFYVKYQGDMQQAVECHEQALKRLIQIQKWKQWEALSEHLVRHEGVTFTPLPKDQHTILLIKSLEALGRLYRLLSGTFAACLVEYEDALDILQTRLETEDPENDTLIHSVAKILRYLSEIYFQRKELDRAVDALHDATAVKLRASGEPCAESLAVMDKMGAANEKMKNWEKALLCYEQTLLARCKFHGNTHIQVATSLVNVARVMELKDGSTEESLDLFRAANAIFALQNTTEKMELGEDTETILKAIPTVIRQGRYEKAVEELNKCLAVAAENDDASIDKAQIYFDLGRAYMGMNDYVKASNCLVEAVKEAGKVSDEEVSTLLKNVEFGPRDGKTSDRAADYEDPPLSLDSINLEMEKEEEEEDAVDNKLERSYGGTSFGWLETSTNPHHQILYESFVQEEDGPRFPHFRANNSSKSRGNRGSNVRRALRERVQKLEAASRPLPAKFAKSISAKVKSLQKKKLPRKLKKLGSKYWKRAFDRKNNAVSSPVSPFRCVVSTQASMLQIVEEDDDEEEKEELVAASESEAKDMKVVGFAKPRFRTVLIEEEVEGFSVQLKIPQ